MKAKIFFLLLFPLYAYGQSIDQKALYEAMQDNLKTAGEIQQITSEMGQKIHDLDVQIRIYKAEKDLYYSLLWVFVATAGLAMIVACGVIWYLFLRLGRKN